jgi:hypothetical protein
MPFHRFRQMARIAAVTASLVLLAPTALAQRNLSFLRDSPVSKFNDEDFKLLRAAAAQLLDGGLENVSQEWKNPKSGNRGSVQVLRVFKATDGRDCRMLRIENHAKTLSSTSDMSVCRHPQRGWLLDAEARPAG